MLVEVEIESETEISVFPWANIGQNDHSNPYIESTTVLSDTCIWTHAIKPMKRKERWQISPSVESSHCYPVCVYLISAVDYSLTNIACNELIIYYVIFDECSWSNNFYLVLDEIKITKM